jgi:hypothetical protein
VIELNGKLLLRGVTGLISGAMVMVVVVMLGILMGRGCGWVEVVFEMMSCS